MAIAIQNYAFLISKITIFNLIRSYDLIRSIFSIIIQIIFPQLFDEGDRLNPYNYDFL